MKLYLLIGFMHIIVFASTYSIKECQYWDDFENRCLHESIYIYDKNSNKIVCKKECQYWSSFYEKCLYETNCQIYKNYILYTECKKFDQFYEKCIDTSTKKVETNINSTILIIKN